MNFVNTQYLPHIIIVGTLLLLIFAYSSHKYFKWVKTYWFFERSWMSRFSGGLYIFSIALMLLSLMDLRGPEQKVASNLPDQRTIIILDSSSSMLAEDVRPSRFGKAIQIARHFVKNSPGHQISLVLFSDVQKRLIPFTDDIDLLDSRLAALEKTNSVSGGSNISLAISESALYFNTDGDKNSAAGNILVLTDAEESEGSFDVEISNNINLAVVGIGTAKGGNIPLRWDDGGFKGYKNYQGEAVTTKLDEEYIKSIGKNVKNYRYWVVNSYTLPTEEIKDFFKGNYNKSQNKGDMRVRPVFSHLILIPAIILYCLSVLFGRFASFKRVLSIGVIFLGLSFNSHSQVEEEPKKIPPEIKLELEKMKTGNVDRKEVLKIAEKLLRNNDEKRASELYNEYVKDGDEEEVFFNQVTSLLKENKMNLALPLASRFLKSSKNEELKDKMRSNLLLGLKKQEEQKKQDEKDKKEKDKKDDKEKKENKENKDDKGQKKEDKQGSDGKGEEQKKKDGKSEGQDKEKNDKKDSEQGKEKEEPKDLVKPERKEGAKSLEEKEKEIEQKRKMVKTPAMIKQILSDDRELQKKMMDTSTRERGDRKPKRDW
jgi:Ca-activated chloride channel family protein